MKVFVIGGKAGSGKTTFGKYLSEELKDYGYKPCIMRISEPLYSYARNYFEWNEREEEKPREFLQKMGIEIIKEKLGKDNFLLDRIFEDIEILSNFFDCFIITDARLVKEFQEIKTKYIDSVTIKLERLDSNFNLDDELKNHITETDLDKYNDFDYIFKNDDFKDIKYKVLEVVRNEEM